MSKGVVKILALSLLLSACSGGGSENLQSELDVGDVQHGVSDLEINILSEEVSEKFLRDCQITYLTKADVVRTVDNKLDSEKSLIEASVWLEALKRSGVNQLDKLSMIARTDEYLEEYGINPNMISPLYRQSPTLKSVSLLENEGLCQIARKDANLQAAAMQNSSSTDSK